jgi:hypothetical protein
MKALFGSEAVAKQRSQYSGYESLVGSLFLLWTLRPHMKKLGGVTMFFQVSSSL